MIDRPLTIRLGTIESLSSAPANPLRAAHRRPLESTAEAIDARRYAIDTEDLGPGGHAARHPEGGLG
jgi:hypothetical protein